ncbi:MAG TPA: glycosyltransferase family 4 protein [Candidatus Dormibacteraeota bacterium]|nr:glycosyltransferase family 4 protein [Candidatus Dormibacteraeota bacterium]
MSAMRSLMLVSAPADARLRSLVDEGKRPKPEYLGLEQKGVELLDWSMLAPPLTKRTWLGSARHARAALRRTAEVDVVFSDGEQVGVPLALGMMLRGITTPHLVLGHRMTAPRKRPFFTRLKAQRAMSRILVHSTHQLYSIQRILDIPSEKLALVPYYADGSFWRPKRMHEERLVVSAGREHRDYETLVRACTKPDIDLFIADGSVHSPHAAHREPRRWPAHVKAGFADYMRLRDMYSRAAVVAVPLLQNDFQAGVTTIIEAMAMGKAVVVSATAGQKDVVEDGLTGLMVPPENPALLREAIQFLLGSPAERRRLGRNARDAFEARFTLEKYTHALLDQMRLIASEHGSRRQAARRVNPA